MQASLIRLAHWKIDIKLIKGDTMHILQWRRHLTHDEVLLNGKLQQTSHGLWGRETIYGLAFKSGSEETAREDRIMLVVDARPNSMNWMETASVRMAPGGVRIEGADGPLLTYGTLDERAYDKPGDFGEWLKRSLGMEW